MKVYVGQVEELLFFSELIINISRGNKQLRLLSYFQRLPWGKWNTNFICSIIQGQLYCPHMHMCKIVSKNKLEEEISEECIATHQSEGMGE